MGELVIAAQVSLSLPMCRWRMILTRRLQTKEENQTPKIGDRRSSGMLKTNQVLREPQPEKTR